jgi:hypothetical protein
MMTFHIGEALLIERAITIAVTIVAFGLMSIGGLYLLRPRRLASRQSGSSESKAHSRRGAHAEQGSDSSGSGEKLEKLEQILQGGDKAVIAEVAYRLITGDARGEEHTRQSEMQSNAPLPSRR